MRVARRSPAASQPFPEELLALLSETDYVTRAGRPNLAAFAEQLEGIHYETLRRSVRGTTTPSLRLIEEVARVLQLSPSYFLEYRIAIAVSRLNSGANGTPEVLRALRRIEGLDAKPEDESAVAVDDDEEVQPFPAYIAEKMMALLRDPAA